MGKLAAFEEGNIYEHLEDIFDGHLFDLQLRLTHLQKENEGLKDELEETRHTISKLDAVQRKQLDVATEAGTMASKFREISENALSAFNDHFNTATDGARENFKDLQRKVLSVPAFLGHSQASNQAITDSRAVTLREQAKDIDDEDSAAVARMMAFSEHVRDLGEVPLDKMILNVQNLVATTEEDFLDMQDDLDQFASSAKQAAEGTLTATKTSMSSRKDRKKYRSSDMDTLVEFPCSDSDQASQDTRTSTPIHHENEGIRYESGQYCVYRAQHH